MPCIISITLRPRQDGRHFTNEDFKCIFLNENVWISIDISLKLIHKGPIDNIPVLVQIMAWCQPGTKPISEPMMVWLAYAYMRHSASMIEIREAWGHLRQWIIVKRDYWILRNNNLLWNFNQTKTISFKENRVWKCNLQKWWPFCFGLIVCTHLS